MLALLHIFTSTHIYFFSLRSAKSEEVIGGSCDCRYGAAGNCKHCAAVAVFVNRHEDESCTSQRQTWGIPSKAARDYDKSTIAELFGPNKHQFVGKKKPMPVEPSYVLEHFPDIECPMVNVLKHISQLSCDSNATEKFSEEVASEDCTVLAQLIRPPTTTYHAFAAICNYPKMVIREKEQEKLLSPEAAQYYEANVKCTDAVYLCALTKGQAKNAR